MAALYYNAEGINIFFMFYVFYVMLLIFAVAVFPPYITSFITF